MSEYGEYPEFDEGCPDSDCFEKGISRIELLPGVTFC